MKQINRKTFKLGTEFKIYSHVKGDKKTDLKVKLALLYTEDALFRLKSEEFKLDCEVVIQKIKLYKKGKKTYVFGESNGEMKKMLILKKRG